MAVLSSEASLTAQSTQAERATWRTYFAKKTWTIGGGLGKPCLWIRHGSPQPTHQRPATPSSPASLGSQGKPWPALCLPRMGKGVLGSRARKVAGGQGWVNIQGLPDALAPKVARIAGWQCLPSSQGWSGSLGLHCSARYPRQSLDGRALRCLAIDGLSDNARMDQTGRIGVRTTTDGHEAWQKPPVRFTKLPSLPRKQGFYASLKPMDTDIP